MKKHSTTLIFAAGFISAAILGLLINSIHTATASSASKAAPNGIAKSNAVNGQALTWTAFDAARNAFKDPTNPSQIRGGGISKDDMMQVMNAIETGGNMAFYFGKESDGKTYVMFLPAAGTESAQRAAIYKSTSFCPNFCN